MHIEFLVEEPSAEAALQNLVPKIVGSDVSFNVHVYQCKHDLLGKLPQRLRGYSHWLPSDWRIVMLMDNDDDNCRGLKRKLDLMAKDAGLSVKTSSRKERFQVVNRLAIEELEAWFFGDVEALATAYPRVPSTLASKSKYRDPDAIKGGTWEHLQRVLRQAGYYPAGLPKIETARRTSGYMSPVRNTSRSFQVFRDVLLQIAGGTHCPHANRSC